MIISQNKMTMLFISIIKQGSHAEKKRKKKDDNDDDDEDDVERVN